MTPGHLRDAEGLTDVFSGVAGFQGGRAALEDPESGATIMLYGGRVTPGYFDALGVTPVRGRAFDAPDGDIDSEPVVVLSQRVWRRFFGEDPALVGSFIDLGGTRSRVIGIVPPGVYPTSASVSGELPFTEGEQDYFELIRFAGDYWTLHGPHLLGGVARLRDGTTPEAAGAALEVLSARAAAEYGVNTDKSVVISPLHEEIVGDVRFGLVTLLAVVVLVFVISAVNVGSLFLLRAEERRSEVALLGAIGAPRGRLLRQRVAEALMVTTLSVALGAWAAGWMVEGMRRLVPYQIPRLVDVSVDPFAVGSALVVSLLLALLLGIVPNVGRRGADGLVGGSRVTTDRRQGRVQSLLIAGQAGLAVVVLVGALLMSRSFAALQANDPGYTHGETWVFELRGRDPDHDADLLERVRATPGVASAAFTMDHPLERHWGDDFQLLEGTGPGRDTVTQGTIRPYGDGYFETVGVELLQGRLPDRLDRGGEPRMALVNDAFRRAYLDEEVAPGRERVWIPSGDRRLGERESVFQIVGVVADVRFLGPSLPSEPAIYVPFEHFAVQGSTLLVRPRAGTEGLLPRLRATLLEVAPGVAIEELGSLDRLRDQALARPRFNMMLLAAMSFVALLLCTLGAYGIVSRTVATRRGEIGVRAALGAAGPAIARSVAGRAVRPLVIGTTVGLAVSLGASRLLASLLYGLSPSDPVSLVGAPLILLLIGGLAAVVPSLRALAVDPAEALRSE